MAEQPENVNNKADRDVNQQVGSGNTQPITNITNNYARPTDGRPFAGVPHLPDSYVDRPDITVPLKAQLLAGQHSSLSANGLAVGEVEAGEGGEQQLTFEHGEAVADADAGSAPKAGTGSTSRWQD